MPLVLHDDRFDTVIDFLQMQSGGVTLGQVCSRFNPRMNERTAQRMLADLVTLGVLTMIGHARRRRYKLRTKPGAFGHVQWFHPDSAGAAAVALPPEPPRPPKKPKAAVSAQRSAVSKDTGAVSAQPSAISRTPNPPTPATPPRNDGAAVSPGLSAPNGPPRQSAPSPSRTTAPKAGERTPANPARTTARPSPVSASPSLDVEHSTFDVGRSPARTPAPPPPLSRQFAQLFAESLPRIISYQDNRSRAELTLQSGAAIAGLTPPELKAYLPAALAQLDTLTAEQAAHYGITPSDYAAWRTAYPAR